MIAQVQHGRAMLALVFVLATTPAFADDNAPIVVRGILPSKVDDVAGSAIVIDSERLTQLRALTLKDVLRTAPGIQLIDEDALGLKLNISVRGLNARRSGRTLLLEDGAPLQPAPYADPSAHHYPPLERVERIEMRKGSGQILFGPQSIGGIINFVTKPVPDRLLLDANAAVGERGYATGHLGIGIGKAEAGVRLDLTHERADGIRDFHGTQVSEAALKTRLSLGVDHALTAKFAYYLERTRLTESGLTQARFDISPYFNPFRNDVFTLDRTSAQLVHDWQIAPRVTLSTQAYVADTFRASYRQTDTSTDTMTANPATGCTGAARTDYERFAALCGNKMRPRRFKFWGIEPRLDADYALGSLEGAFTAGARVHIERTNRKRYNGLTPDARETSVGTVLRDDNDIATDALSGYAQNRLAFGSLGVTAGFRVERILTRNRARRANFVAVGNTARTLQTLVLPGVGVTWERPAITLFAGVHRGFAPPRPDRDFNPNVEFNAVRPERSIETEIGFRAHPMPGLTIDVTAFNLELTDLIVEGPLVGGRSGSFVNAGAARHRGLEFDARWSTGIVRARLAYTWLAGAKFLADVDDTARGVRGNRIPYTPEHLLDAGLGIVTGAIDAELGFNHVSRQFANADNRTIASADGAGGLVPARTLIRATMGYAIPSSGLRLFATVENLGNVRYISSRIDGLFAGEGRRAVLGINYKLP